MVFVLYKDNKMAKLKDILNESNVQLGKVYSNPYATPFVKENEEHEESEVGFSEEQRKAFFEAVKQYRKYGESVYRNAGLEEVYETIKNMVEVANKVTLSETGDWFDNVTVGRHMKRMGESFKVFEKTLKEVGTLQQRLESSYDEIGEVLSKYYEINEMEDEIEEGNEFGAARAKAIANGDDSFEVDGKKYPVKDVDKDDKENAKDFANESTSMKLTDILNKSNPINEVNTRLNKKVKSFMDAYLKGIPASSPEYHHTVMVVLKGALTDANFHSEAKKLDSMFPKAKKSKYYDNSNMNDVMEDKGVDIAGWAKWDGHDILDAFSYFTNMTIGGGFGNKLETLKESVNEGVEPQIKKIAHFTGTRPEAVEDFVSKHSLNITKLLKYVQKGGLPQRMELVSALAGRDGNATQKKVIKMFSESVNEGIMSEIDILAKESKDLKDFVKKFKKEYSDLTDAGDIKELEAWLKTVYSDAKNESVNEAGEFAGWIAGYNGKKVEIKKGEAKDLYNAKLLAIKKLKVPKSKVGLMFIKPAVDESINEGKFKVDDLVYNKRTKTVGIVRMGDDKYGEVKTDADGNVSVDELEQYNPIKFKHQSKAKAAPSTQKEVSKRGLFNPFKSESVMNEAKYDIGMARKGNGITIYNKAEEENGDYKNVAHIDNKGNVKYLDKKIPSNIKKQIEAEAKKMMEITTEAKGNTMKLKDLLNESFGMGELPSSKLLKMKVSAKDMLESVGEDDVNEARVSAKKLLQSVVKGETDRVEGIKLSKEMAQSFLDWQRMSPFGKKYGNLPFNRLFTAAFNWGLNRHADKKSKEYKELEAKAKQMFKARRSESVVTEGASTEEKRIVMLAVKKIAKYRNVPIDQSVVDVIRAAEELQRDIQNGKVKK